jgi:hypothetical protein
LECPLVREECSASSFAPAPPFSDPHASSGKEAARKSTILIIYCDADVNYSQVFEGAEQTLSEALGKERILKEHELLRIFRAHFSK